MSFVLLATNVLRLGDSGGFLAQKFNRRTTLKPTTKLSYEALHPPLRQTAVTRLGFLSVRYGSIPKINNGTGGLFRPCLRTLYTSPS